jgi:hypothetical protein
VAIRIELPMSSGSAMKSASRMGCSAGSKVSRKLRPPQSTTPLTCCD